jgi:transcriptional regulator with XRE-family HTH domain
VLGDRIRELREAHPVYRSLRHFAEALKKSPSWVSKVERNLEIPGDETLLEIARLLNADEDELLQLARMIHPEVREAIAAQYKSVSGLLRKLTQMSPEQIERLNRQADEITDEDDQT